MPEGAWFRAAADGGWLIAVKEQEHIWCIRQIKGMTLLFAGSRTDA